MMMLLGSFVSGSGPGLQVTKYLLPTGDFVTKTGAGEEGGGSVWPLELRVPGWLSEVVSSSESVPASEMFAIEIRVISGLAFGLA